MNNFNQLQNELMNAPLVSVIITCYNQGNFLQKSIQTAFDLNFKNTEVIVIDDGSTDDTATIANSFKNILYHFQKNQGLSAARNTGINLSKGSYILFLDADDWLYPDGLSYSVTALEKNEKVAFISGSFLWINSDGSKGEGYPVEEKDPYLLLLERNYIGMHGTVLYRRSVLEKFKFDHTLKACEDYDLYLQIAAQFPVMHHNKFMAVYRKHGENMSDNYTLMLNEVEKVLLKHKLLEKLLFMEYTSGK
jgi:glycosyltransferase involved in cell wall biosynthesis